jgi:hypothetical protein
MVDFKPPVEADLPRWGVVAAAGSTDTGFAPNEGAKST